MKTVYQWTPSNARLQLIHSNAEESYNWLFLPGGPGLGSESLALLTRILHLPGTVWHLDLPGDGSNLIKDDNQAFSRWQKALIEAVSAFQKVILVAHSTGGMYALSTPALEKHLMGLVILNSAPDSSWQTTFMNYVQQHPIPKLSELQTRYEAAPCNEYLKALTLEATPYLFTETGLEVGIRLLSALPYNFSSHEWSAKHFDSVYQAKWAPKLIPTLLLSGQNDCITPIQLFKNAKNFIRANIDIYEIEKAGHFPWVDNPTQVANLFKKYCKKIIGKY